MSGTSLRTGSRSTATSPRLIIRGAFYEQLEDEPFEKFFDQGQSIFEDGSLEILPIEFGLRFNLSPGWR